MNLNNSASPSLCSISQCKTELNFEPLSHWPDGLPAVAVNNWVLAGFSQKLVFNHSLDTHKDQDRIAQLFHSLYHELSFVELVRLWSRSKDLSWFPFHKIAASYEVNIDEKFPKLAEVIIQLPAGFQTWCALKKTNAEELSPLTSARKLKINPLLQKILRLKMNKLEGLQALHLGIELLAQGYNAEELGALEGSEFCEQLMQSSAWVAHLRHLRFPSEAASSELATDLSLLPWPGSSQVKWTTHGDKTGIEISLFVSRPEDLKRYAKSFEEIQELMESSAGIGPRDKNH